ncbi:de756cf3-fdae-4bdc-96a2-f8c1af7e431d [Sclerotinia trifoliorum]|uniref:De756cf3-fdae-4bdc-96a2-f8c1af7e431d n=1 Tax=Sclerotinia trifoliorum TaxID=28548 RepID=A0A8H2ZQG2_9HELO|nr:de756cf3-fdae-4bdc-96a2-f8c1af7e431d [Sclerotinia trifoliorum]
MDTLSSRCLQNISSEEIRNFMGTVFGNPWSEENPDGIFPMGIAENRLMHHEIAEYINKNFRITPKMLTYGDGPTGSFELRAALAGFWNSNFSPKKSVSRDHVTVMGGGSSILDALSYCIAEEDEGILVAQPFYVGFVGDFEDRARVKVVPVSIGSLENVTTITGVHKHEEALLAARQTGIKIKALLLCNPHNPLGRCYAPEVLEAYLCLCSKYNIHLISDEIYAQAVFPNQDIPNPMSFTSILSLDIEKFCDPALVCVVYGMSKDFCSNGLRIGCIISQHNPILHRTVGAITKFAWASSLSDHVWTLMLNDQKFLDYYFSTLSQRMTTAYEICTQQLKEFEISYIPASCGPFIWIDLRSYLTSPTIEAERILSWKMLKFGIWLATGEAFASEEPGWYRITFAMSEENLRFGMNRLWKVLGTVGEENRQLSVGV